jgi:hypothetical protein
VNIAKLPELLRRQETVFEDALAGVEAGKRGYACKRSLNPLVCDCDTELRIPRIELALQPLVNIGRSE